MSTVSKPISLMYLASLPRSTNFWKSRFKWAQHNNFYLITSRWSYVNNWTFIDKLSLKGGDITLTATGAVPVYFARETWFAT
jgi:hypothetical protein